MIPVIFLTLLLPIFTSGQYASTFEWSTMQSIITNQVSARPTTMDDDVWTISPLAFVSIGVPLRYDWAAGNWELKTSGLGLIPIANKQVSASTDGWAWLVTTTNLVYRFNATSETWTSMSFSLKQIDSVSKDSAIGVAPNGTVWTWTGSAWSQVGSTTTAAQANIGIDGDKWMVDTSGATYQWVSSAWVSRSTTPGMFAVRVHKTGRVVAVESSTATVYKWNGASWTSLGFTSISASITDKKVYGLTGVLSLPLVPRWALVLEVILVTPAFNATRISARGSELWATIQTPSTPDFGLPHRHNGTHWEAKSTTPMKDIASNSDGLVWACSDTNALLRWNGSAFASTSAPTTYERISSGADGSNTAFAGKGASGSNFECAQYNGTTWMDRCTGETATTVDIGMGVDGSIWKVKQDIQMPYYLQRWAGSYWDEVASSPNPHFVDVYNTSRIVALFYPTAANPIDFTPSYLENGGWKKLNLVATTEAIAISESKIYYNGPQGVSYVEF